MQILLVAATPFEIAPALTWLESNFSPGKEGVFEKNDLIVAPLITGPGPIATCWRLARAIAPGRPAFALNAGIAGAFDRDLDIGDVVNVTSERFGDLGAEEADGNFSDLFDLGLANADSPPFQKGKLHNPSAGQATFLPEVQGLTVSKVHGWKPSIETIRKKYPDARVESMEGAAFFYACLLTGIPFLEIRSISNYVEPRNREGWNLPLAIENLNKILTEMLDSFSHQP